VTGSSGLASATSYTYDRDANRTSLTRGGATTSYAYDRTAQLVSLTDAGGSTSFATTATATSRRPRAPSTR
jgi:YD repeat-containing protein